MSAAAVIALFVLIATALQVWTTAMDLQDNHRLGISASSAAAELRGSVLRPFRWLRRSREVRAALKQVPGEWRAYVCGWSSRC